jgi:hypothetical protein
VHAYVRPVVSPVTVTALLAAVPEPETPPSDETQLAVKSVIAAPSSAPAVKVTTSGPVAAVAAPDTACGLVGAEGAPTTNCADGADARPVPREFVPVTLHVYVLPVVRPDNAIGLALPVCVAVAPPLLETHEAVKLVIAAPLLAPEVKLTVAPPVAFVVDAVTAATAVGGAGDPTITAADAVDGLPVPAAFVAVAVQVYVFPVVSAVTLIGLAVPELAPVTPPFAEVHVTA